MFSDEDFKEYLEDLEKRLKKEIILYTDVLNELSNREVESRLMSYLKENTQAFKFLKEQRLNHFSKE